MKFITLSLSACALILAGTAAAQAPQPQSQPHVAAAPQPVIAPLPGPDEAFYSDEAKLQREVRLLQLTEQVAALTKKIASASAPAGAQTDAAPVAIAPPPAGPQGRVTKVAAVSIPEPVPSAPDMVLVSVIGVGGHYVAVLSDHGARINVHLGDELTDGWEVTSIQPTTVALRRGRAHRTVRMGG